jgi:hypothetical protein
MKEADYRHITYGITMAAARVLGKTENDLLRLPFQAAYMFLPGGICGAAWGENRGRGSMRLLGPLMPLLYWVFPQ